MRQEKAGHSGGQKGEIKADHLQQHFHTRRAGTAPSGQGHPSHAPRQGAPPKTISSTPFAPSRCWRLPASTTQQGTGTWSSGPSSWRSIPRAQGSTPSFP
eukprot:360870-Chlamydomonas_euryale.AAC.25